MGTPKFGNVSLDYSGLSRFYWGPASAPIHSQQDDLVLLAHARSSFALSNGTYGSPRMTRELQDNGFAVGRRRMARLMRENDLKARQKRRFKRTTDGEHSCRRTREHQARVFHGIAGYEWNDASSAASSISRR